MENNSNILGGSMFKRKKYQQICSQMTLLHKTFLEEVEEEGTFGKFCLFIDLVSMCVYIS